MSSETGRSRRSLSRDAIKKIEALEKLRSLNRSGVKNKYQLVEEKMVYDEVDEDSYAELVSKRQREDWIVDDDGAGYAEHGREIFDDDYDDGLENEDVEPNKLIQSKNKYKLFSSKIQNKDDSSISSSGNSDIRNIFSSMTKKFDKKANLKTSPITLTGSLTKKSLNEVKIDDSEIDSLVDSITSTSTSSHSVILNQTQPLKLQKKLTSSSIKRKTFEHSSKILQEIPPFKRRNNLFKSNEFNFEDIVDNNPEEIMKTSISSDNSNLQLKKSSDIKQESIEDFKDDYMLPDNSKYDDSDDDVSTISATKLINKSTIDHDSKVKIEKFPEEWIISNQENDKKDDKSLKSFCDLPISKKISFETDKDNNKLIKFYWFDAFYDPMNHHDQSNRIFLFGKVYLEKEKKFISCCLEVKNLERRIFILPRDYFLNDRARRVQIEDVYQEFAEEVAPKIKIKQFRSRKVVKKYAFDLENIPPEAEYLEVLYSTTYPPLSLKFLQGNSYRHVFGVNSSILENFILDFNLMGPGWLVIKNPEITDPPISWCKLEFNITKPSEQISILSEKLSPPPPYFTILSLCFKTYVHQETKTADIVAISCLVNKQFNFDTTGSSKTAKKFDEHFFIITKISGKNGKDLPLDFNYKMALKDYQKTRIFMMNSERELLMFFIARFQQIDPDIIIGHDIYNFDYDILLQRFSNYKIPLQWSKLGRLKYSGLPIRSKDKHMLAGRLICDIKIISHELIRLTSYDLTELAAQLLKKGRFEIDQNLLSNYYQNSNQLIRFVEFLMKDNDLILSIAFELNCLQLAKQITNIAGNLLSRTLLGGRAERNEYLLLHAFYQRGYIVPDKITVFNSKTNSLKKEIMNDKNTDDQKKSEEMKKSYTGGLVLQPKIGYYDRFILLMDFNSLYPSIIQEFNICFTTVKSSQSDKDICDLPQQSNDNQQMNGILPIEIRKLVESRREVKRLLCDHNLPVDQRGQLDIKQKALKITANSMYGCLGFNHSRFYAKHLAALITQKGREILLNTKELVEKMGFDVIYGDTDSIMILTNCLKYEDVREIGRQIQAEVNRFYKLLEIDIDGVFRCMLLLKKKKYAALSVSSGSNQTLKYQKEVKGLDIIRRDWSVVAKLAGEAILDQILKPDQASEVIVDNIHQYLKQLADKIRANELPIENFVINKALAKKPEEYGNEKKSLTHVMIALRYNEKNLGKKLVAGDTVPFVICLDGSKNSATQRGYHIDEVRQKYSEQNLRIDIDYYLSQQLLPVVSRLCDPIDGTDAGIIAEFLGIESNFKRSNKTNETDPSFNCGDYKYDCCHSLIIYCPYESCSKPNEIRNLFRLWNQKSNCFDIKDLKNCNAEILFDMTIARCEHCQRSFHREFTEFYLELQLIKQINQYINKFCQRWMICDDHVCSFQTQYLSGLANQKYLICPRCRNGNLQPEISEHFIYQQLTFFHHIFDFDTALQRFNELDLSDKLRSQLNKLKQKYGELFQRLQRTVQYFLDQSSYNEFDLGFLFRKFRYNQQENNFKK